MVEALTPVIFEGGTELLVVWEYFLYLGPEKCGVVHLLSVTQLVDYHVVYDFGSGVHQCTVEIQVTGGAAASPAGLLISYGDGGIVPAGEAVVVFHTIRKHFSGSIPISVFQSLQPAELRNGQRLIVI